MKSSGFDDAIASWNEDGSFSGVISIRRDGEPLVEEAHGLAHLSEQISNRIDTRFGIASGCKIFTALAICRLIEDGRATPSSLLSDCVDVSFPGFDPAITLHQLLTHSSGIPDYFDEEFMTDYEATWRDVPMYSIRGPRDFLPLFADRPMKFAPGKRLSYSNAGFILLGLVVEHLSGLSFRSYVRERVFEPAGMRDSGYFPLDRLPPRTALGYIRDDDGSLRSNIYSIPIIGGPDGGAFTTAADMAAFWDALLKHRLLGEQMTRSLLEPFLEASDMGSGISYGCGVYVAGGDGRAPGYCVCGADPGISFLSAVFPESGMTATVLGNGDKDTWPLLAAIRDILSQGA
jgi:CubicO group peptidase (beta-lactamase class C family)